MSGPNINETVPFFPKCHTQSGWDIVTRQEDGAMILSCKQCERPALVIYPPFRVSDIEGNPVQIIRLRKRAP